MRPCAQCGASFQPRHPTAKYCGTVCKHRAATVAKRKHPLVPRPCQRCGTAFLPTHPLWHRYCSDACRIRANKPRVSIPARACGWCGKRYQPRNLAGVYCGRACYQAAKRAHRQPAQRPPAATKPCPGCGTPIAARHPRCTGCQEHQNVQSQYQKAHGKGVLWVLDKRCPRCRKPTVEAALCYRCSTGRERRITMPAHLIKPARVEVAA